MIAERDGGSDGRALRPLTDAFDPEDQPLLEAVSRDHEGRTQRQKNPHSRGSLAFATWVCARLGGWTSYYGDNLQVLRDHIASESIDLIYLDRAGRR